MNQYTSESPQDKFARFWSHVAITADDNQCWLWLGSCNEKGYGTSKLGANVKAHRIAWLYPNYIIPHGMEICHSCDVRNCCNPKHLFVGTHKENMKDMNTKGRGVYVTGEQVGTSKLSSVQVSDIRKSYAQNNISLRQLAIDFQSSKTNIRRIVRHQSRKNG